MFKIINQMYLFLKKEHDLTNKKNIIKDKKNLSVAVITFPLDFIKTFLKLILIFSFSSMFIFWASLKLYQKRKQNLSLTLISLFVDCLFLFAPIYLIFLLLVQSFSIASLVFSCLGLLAVNTLRPLQ